jgi:hypothetical protein
MLQPFVPPPFWNSLEMESQLLLFTPPLFLREYKFLLRQDQDYVSNSSSNIPYEAMRFVAVVVASTKNVEWIDGSWTNNQEHPTRRRTPYVEKTTGTWEQTVRE